jgi:hypothetical protein
MVQVPKGTCCWFEKPAKAGWNNQPTPHQKCPAPFRGLFKQTAGGFIRLNNPTWQKRLAITYNY